MKTEVAILHKEYPETVRDLAVSKIEHLIRYFDGTVSIRAVLERQKEEHRVELVANVRQGVVLVVDAKETTVGAALDEAVDRMRRVLRRHKDKIKDKRKGRGK
ncbi:MAG TPA: ribosome-associated translation inhibitor RaiA [Planctomycetes bacterium]|nr:ribosome-associated translation inhibitor RaiA [Planctomycetota bacterium]